MSKINFIPHLFCKNNLIDELYLTLSPFIVAGEDAPNLLNTDEQLKQKLILKNCQHKNGFVFLDYNVDRKS